MSWPAPKHGSRRTRKKGRRYERRTALRPALQRSLEQRGGKRDHDGSRNCQIEQVRADRREARILQQNGLEAVYRVGEGIDIGDSAEPRRKRLNGIDGAAG